MAYDESPEEIKRSEHVFMAGFGIMVSCFMVSLFATGCQPQEPTNALPSNRVQFDIKTSPDNHSGWVNINQFKVNRSGVLHINHKAPMKTKLDEKLADVLVAKVDGKFVVYVPNELNMNWGTVYEYEQIQGYQEIHEYNELDMGCQAIDLARREGLINELVSYKQ